VRVLIVTETRVYEVPDDEAEALQISALMGGTLDRIPVSISRHATTHEPDEDGLI
jgi:hypothetical protein